MTPQIESPPTFRRSSANLTSVPVSREAPVLPRGPVRPDEHEWRDFLEFAMDDAVKDSETADASPVAPAPGPPQDDGMDEKRFAKMESDLSLARADMRVASSGMRADMAEFKQAVQASITEQRVESEKFRADSEKFRGEIKALFGELRGDMHQAQSSMKNWIVATVLAILFGFAALVFRLPGPVAAPAPQPSSVTQPAP